MEDYSRITGIASGLDTAGMVKQMLKAEQMKVDKVKAQRERKVWKQSAYREITTMIKGLESSYFDLLNKKNHLGLPSSYSRFKASIKLNGEKSSIVSADIKGDATFDRIEINEIKQLATAETWKAVKTVKNIEGDFNIDTITSENADAEELNITLKLDGVEKKLTLKGPKGYASADEFKTAFVDELKSKIDGAFGEKTVHVVQASGKIGFISNKHKLEMVSNDFGTGMTIEEGAVNYIDMDAKVKDLLGINSTVSFTIKYESQEKATSVSIQPDDTIAEAMKKINDGQDVAELKHDSLSGKFVLTSKKFGVNGAIKVENQATQEFLDKLGLTQETKAAGKAQNAILTINGVEITDDNNSIKLDGVKIDIHKTHVDSAEPIVITKDFDGEDMVEKMKGFVKKYNELIVKVNGLLSEKRNYKFNPLSEQQKKDMEDDEIEKWEAKAKKGLLRNDTGLERMMRDLRQVFNDPVKGVSISMKEIGLYLTDNYKDNGKIAFNEEKFKKALEERGSEVVDLLTARSEIAFDPKTSEEKKERYEEVGVMQRIQDIFKYAASTTTLRSEKKGYLVEKAGIKGTSSELHCELSMEMLKIDRRVDYMMKVLYEKEDQYYKQFAQLERAMAQMQAQADSFAGLM